MADPRLETVETPPRFKKLYLPQGGTALLPDDINLEFPQKSKLEDDRLHFLVSIPWDDAYLSRVDEEYRDFFKEVLPYLHARTTDVHIATCMRFIKELIADVKKAVETNESASEPKSINERMVAAAFILHDAGWSEMSEEEIAASLGVTGLALTDAAMGPKEKHAILGGQVAEVMLSRCPCDPPMTDAEKEEIYQAVLFHDKPMELAKGGDIPLEMKLVCDVDHLWSFTHENFWQDTVRKGVAPEAYLENLGKDLDGYFVTEEGRAKARALLAERAKEVEAWKVAAAVATDRAG
jgi:hypothetical protein